MIFNTHQLSETLSSYIESVFHFKNFVPDHSIERVVPTGHLFIIFELDGFERHTYDNNTLKPNANYTKVWVSGMHKNYISISAHENSEMFVIQFKPIGAYPFLHFAVDELNEKVVSAETVFGDSILDLHQNILDAETSEDKFKIAEDWLTKKFEASKTPPNELLDIVKEFQKAPVSKYEAIVKTYPKSQKHLISQFKKYVGLTPKYFQRILRFNEILARLQHKEKISWAEIVYSCGFSDQSHFIKEFQHFSGFNPSEFIDSSFNKDEPNFFPLDRKG